MKKLLLILLSIIPISIYSQNMIWTGMGMTDHRDKCNLFFGVEERVYIPFGQKDFALNYKVTFTVYKIMPLVGLSVWDHTKNREVRPYYGIDSRYFRFIIEHRIADDITTRLRARTYYRQKLTNWLSLVASEEVFWAEGFDHNRLNLGTQFKLNRVQVDLGYMSYYKDKNQNTLVIKLNYNL